MFPRTGEEGLRHGRYYLALFIAHILSVVVFCESSSGKDFTDFLKGDHPAGEAIFTQTLYGIEHPSVTGPLEQTYYVAWNGTDFVVRQIGKDEDPKVKLDVVHRALMGRYGETYWHVVNRQLTVIDISNNRTNLPPDGQIAKTQVEGTRALIDHLVRVGFGGRFSDALWADRDRFSVMSAGALLRCNLQRSTNGSVNALLISSGEEASKITFDKWQEVDGFPYPAYFEASMRQKSGWEISTRTVVSKISFSPQFSPDAFSYSAHINPASFDYIFVTNGVYAYKGPDGVHPVELNAPSMQKGRGTWVVMLMLFSTAVFVPVIVKLRRENKQ